MDKNEIEVDIKVPNQTRYLSLIGRIGEDIAKELDRFDGDRIARLPHQLVLTEAMVNAIKHANANDPDKMVHVYINITDRTFSSGFSTTARDSTSTAFPRPTSTISKIAAGGFLSSNS